MKSNFSLKGELVSAGFFTAWALAGRVPERRLFAALDIVAVKAYERKGPSVRMLERNYSRVHPEWDCSTLAEKTKEGVRKYARYWGEVLCLPLRDRGWVESMFSLHGRENIDSAVQAGGVILVAPHSGSLDLSGAWAANRYGRVMTVAERLKPESLYRQFVKHREKFAIDILPTGNSDNLEVLSRRIKEGGVVALAADRDIGRKGVHVDFFGSLASFPAGPALLSKATGAPVVVLDLFFR